MRRLEGGEHHSFPPINITKNIPNFMKITKLFYNDNSDGYKIN